MKKTVAQLAVILALTILVGVSTLQAGEEILIKGAFFPSVTLSIPHDPGHKSYLGLSGSGTFDIPDIKAEIVIVEIFSMY